jgi:hypothetical protein
VLGIPDVHYAEGHDGLIAYETVGEGPVDLVHIGGWYQTVEGIWELPSAERFYRRLASFARVVLVDRRARDYRIRWAPCTRAAISARGSRRR